MTSKTRVALATQHGKEKQFSPVFAEVLGWHITVAPLDTDVWGTFSGDVPRHLSPRDTALEKARTGARSLGYARGMASEGTVGPHPAIPFLTVDHEIAAFVDLESGIEVVESVLNPDIVAVSEIWDDTVLLEDIMEKADLPRHALIARTDSGSSPMVVKGMTSRAELERAIDTIRRDDPDATIVFESDHRAMMSPSRQVAIEECARKLATRLASLCPSCSAMGWGLVDCERGVPCRECGTLSADAISGDVEGCVRCDHRITIRRGISEVDPAHCLVCNP